MTKRKNAIQFFVIYLVLLLTLAFCGSSLILTIDFDRNEELVIPTSKSEFKSTLAALIEGQQFEDAIRILRNTKISDLIDDSNEPEFFAVLGQKFMIPGLQTNEQLSIREVGNYWVIPGTTDANGVIDWQNESFNFAKRINSKIRSTNNSVANDTGKNVGE